MTVLCTRRPVTKAPIILGMARRPPHSLLENRLAQVPTLGVRAVQTIARSCLVERRLIAVPIMPIYR